MLCITWDASPVADLVADSIALSAIELTRSPPAVQAALGQEDEDMREARVFRVLCTYLQQEFGRLEVDEKAQVASFEVDGSSVTVEFPTRSVRCESEVLQERVRLSLRRCETALRPIAPF